MNDNYNDDVPLISVQSDNEDSFVNIYDEDQVRINIII